MRHSESTYNQEGRWAGWLDSPLTPAGVAAAEQAAAVWKSRGVDAVCSSDLQRASSGASILARELGVPVGSEVRGLRERNAGRWQGRLREELVDDAAYQRWRTDERSTPPDGETYEEFTGRLVEAVGGLLSAGGVQLVVTHDGVLTALSYLFDISRPVMRPLVDAIEVARDSDGVLAGVVVGVGDVW